MVLACDESKTRKVSDASGASLALLLRRDHARHERRVAHAVLRRRLLAVGRPRCAGTGGRPVSKMATLRPRPVTPRRHHCDALSAVVTKSCGMWLRSAVRPARCRRAGAWRAARSARAARALLARGVPHARAAQRPLVRRRRGRGRRQQHVGRPAAAGTDGAATRQARRGAARRSACCTRRLCAACSAYSVKLTTSAAEAACVASAARIARRGRVSPGDVLRDSGYANARDARG